MNGSLESNLDQVGMWCLPLSSTLRNLDMQCWVAIIAIKIVIIASTTFSRLRKVWVVVGLSTFHWRLWQKLSQEREKGGKYNCTNSSEERLQKQKIGEIQLKIHPIYFPLNSDKTDLKLNIKSLWRVMQYKYKEFIKRNTPTCCGSKVQTRDAF